MKKILIVLLLFCTLLLTAHQMVMAQTAPSEESAAPVLPVPRDIRFAYANGTRSVDGKPGPNYWQNHAVHDMTITVAPPSRTISATQAITYTNNSPYPLSGVIFKLLQNVHRPDAMRERVYEESFFNDGLQIDEFRVNGVAQPWGPDSGFIGTHLVPISPTLASNSSVNFTITWHYELADHVENTKEGAVDDTTFFLAYFFPRIAVLDDVNPTGFDTAEFTYGGREQYNDFADFKVAVNAPKNFIVWATGDLQNPDEVLQPDYAQRLQASLTSDEVINIAQPAEIQQGLVTTQTDTVTWRWQANNVPDFVVALSDHYIWDAGSVVVDPATGRRASVQAAYDEPAADFQQMVEFGKSALDFGSTQWPGVPYPYSKTTLFRGVADEEYPMFANDSSNEDPTFTRFVAAHELLHSWFPFYMGINEQRYGFMDEGWTTAFEYIINTRDLGPEQATTLFQQFRSRNLVTPFSGVDIPIVTPSDSLDGNVLGRNNYEKAALGYLALKELMGEDLFKQALHEFMARWNGKHPIPWDMFNTFNDATGQNYNWFFLNWFFAANYLDLAIGDVQQSAGSYTVQVNNVGGMAMPFDLTVLYADDSTVAFRQTPALWQDSPQRASVTFAADQAVKSITLDGGIFMDVNPTDNVWQNPAAPTPATEAITTTVPTTVTTVVTETTTVTETAPMTATAAPPTAELNQLRANGWQWVSYIGPVEHFFVDNAAKYTLTFNDDGRVNIGADCNRANGAYQGEGGNLTIEVGAMTRAACPPESRSDQFVTFLGYATDYFFEDGYLHIDLFADGGTLVFSPAPPALFGDDGEGAVAGLPATLVTTLGDLSYSGLVEDREITLASGVYTETSDAETIVVHLLDSFVALGDLNGDGNEDAVALLELDTSGSGRFTFAAPVLDLLTMPIVGMAVEIGDRIQPNALSITDGQVVAEYIGHGAGDGDCCPSWNIRSTFAWQDDALVEVSREEVSKVEAAAASSIAHSSAWEPVACDTLGVQAEIAAQADCGYVTVPENRAAGTDKMIQLAVVRIRSTSDNPGAPIILGTGGPGGDGLGRIKLDPAFLPSHTGILEDRDWIGFTQRGTAGAIPELPCTAFSRVVLDAALQGLTPAKNIELRKTTMQACLDHYTAEGIDLTGYNSVENAADVVAVIDALGYDKVFYYGQSYGTMLGQYLLKDHGDRLAGIILDGIAPVTHTSWPDISDMPAAFRRVFDACAADAACAAAYPEPEAALAAGLQALDANPPALTVKTEEGDLTVSVDSTLAMHALFTTLYTQGGYSTVPWLAYELSNGNAALLSSSIALLFGSDDMRKVMHFAVVCSDDPLLSMDDLSMAGIPPMYQGLRADDALDYATACPLLALPQLPASYDTLVESELPALLLQGGLDPATGVPVGSTVQEGLPNSTNVIVPAAGHIVGNAPCVIGIMDAFMNDPQAALDTSCIDPAVPFSVPGPVSVTSPDGSATLGITLPGGYGLLSPGIWQGVEAYLGLTIEKPRTTADDAVALQLAAISAKGEATDGPEVAGQPSRMVRTAHPLGDLTVYGFADAERSYALFIIVKDPAKAEEFRQHALPALLESVTLGSE